MKDKNVTMRDVANLAGVSVATVSYVLNDKQTEKISEETRHKVWQIVNLLGYQPSSAARMLATGKSQLVGVYVGDARAYTAPFCDAFNEVLESQGYRMLTLHTLSNTELFRELDAVILVGQPVAVFKSISDRLLKPILCVDMHTDDPLFYQIYDDLAGLMKAAAARLHSNRFFTVLQGVENEVFRQWATKSAPSAVHIYRDNAQLSDFLRQQAGIPGLCLGLVPALAARAQGHDAPLAAAVAPMYIPDLPPQIIPIPLSPMEKARQVYSYMQSAIDRVDGLPHDIPIPVDI